MPSETLIIAITCLYGVNRAWLESGEEPMFAPTSKMVNESEVLRAYREDIEILHRRIEELVNENQRIGKKLGKKKLEEIGREVREKKPAAYNHVAENTEC